MADLAILTQILVQYFVLSLLSIGGANATLSELHRFLVIEHGWISEARFVELYALSQAAPGPNVLFVALFGLQIAGLAGLVVSLVGICAPSSLLAIAVEKVSSHPRVAPAITVLKRALAGMAVGLVLATGIVLARTADTRLITVALTAGALVAILRWRWHPLSAIAVGAGVGAIWLG